MERPFVFPPLHTHTQDLKLSLKQYSTNGQCSSKLVVSKYQKNKEQANIEQQWNVFFTTLPGKGLIYSFLKQNLAHLQLINLKISASYNQTLRQILVLCKFEKSGKCSLSLKLEQRVCWIGNFPITYNSNCFVDLFESQEGGKSMQIVTFKQHNGDTLDLTLLNAMNRIFIYCELRINAYDYWSFWKKRHFTGVCRSLRFSGSIPWKEFGTLFHNCLHCQWSRVGDYPQMVH